MKRFIPVVALLLASCVVDPLITPDPSTVDAGLDAATSSSSSTGSSSSTSSSGGGFGDSSGTRLKRYVYTGPDGLHALRGGVFFDSTLGIDCEPRVTIVGLRCMPRIPVGAFKAGMIFSDSACSVGAVLMPKQCGVVAYFSAFVGDSCGNISATSVRDLVPIPNGVTFEGTPSNCTQSPPHNLTIWDVYEIGPEVGHGQFAAMSLEHE